MKEHRTPLVLTREHARAFLLAYHRLYPPRGLAGKAGILDFLSRVGCIQYDPLSIVGNNPELVLQSRIADFRPAFLRELLYTDRMLLDGWDKMMSIYPSTDWPFFARERERSRRRFDESGNPSLQIIPDIVSAIISKGPLSSSDFSFNHLVEWSWAPTRASRAALESLYFRGDLVIHHRVHTRKYYDLAARHLPGELLSAPPPFGSEEAYLDWRIQRRIAGIGLLWNRSGDAWLGLHGLRKPEREESIIRLVEGGNLHEVQVEGMETPFYMPASALPVLESLTPDSPGLPGAAVLAPLDNLLWDRKLLQALFGFDYRWEVYKPAEQRTYGYYVLPVLYGDRFIARFEPARTGRAMVIRNWWWEPGTELTLELKTALVECFRTFLSSMDLESLTIAAGAHGLESIRWLAEEASG